MPKRRPVSTRNLVDKIDSFAARCVNSRDLPMSNGTTNKESYTPPFHLGDVKLPTQNKGTSLLEEEDSEHRSFFSSFSDERYASTYTNSYSRTKRIYSETGSVHQGNGKEKHSPREKIEKMSNEVEETVAALSTNSEVFPSQLHIQSNRCAPVVEHCLFLSAMLANSSNKRSTLKELHTLVRESPNAVTNGLRRNGNFKSFVEAITSCNTESEWAKNDDKEYFFEILFLLFRDYANHTYFTDGCLRMVLDRICESVEKESEISSRPENHPSSANSIRSEFNAQRSNYRKGSWLQLGKRVETQLNMKKVDQSTRSHELSLPIERRSGMDQGTDQENTSILVSSSHISQHVYEAWKTSHRTLFGYLKLLTIILQPSWAQNPEALDEEESDIKVSQSQGEGSPNSQRSFLSFSCPEEHSLSSPHVTTDISSPRALSVAQTTCFQLLHSESFMKIVEEYISKDLDSNLRSIILASLSCIEELSLTCLISDSKDSAESRISEKIIRQSTNVDTNGALLDICRAIKAILVDKPFNTREVERHLSCAKILLNLSNNHVCAELMSQDVYLDLFCNIHDLLVEKFLA